MYGGRVPSFVLRSILFFIFTSFFLLLPSSRLIAQGDPELPWNPVPVTTPAMHYQPPLDANDLNDFLPPGSVYINATTVPTPTLTPPMTPGGTLTPPGGTVTLPAGTSTVPTATIPLADAPIVTTGWITSTLTPTVIPTIPVPPEPITTVITLPETGGGILFHNQQVAVIVEGDTFSQTVDFHFISQTVATYPITLTNTISNPASTRTLLSFQIETIDAVTGEIISGFEHPTRLVVDMRDLTEGLNPVYSDFWLAYRDPDDPNVWREVPVTIHQADGLISAEVTHFSEWASGVRPERWNPSWNPPTVSEFSGAATYSYPIEVPPGRNGLQPNVALSYSSRSLDGRIQDGEPGVVADGWSLAEINISRVDVRMESVGDVPYTHMRHRFRLVLNGSGHELVAGGDGEWGGTRYHATDAPGLYVELHDITVSGSNRQRLYWSVVTADGVYYRLGSQDNAEESQQVSNASHMFLEGSSPVNNPTRAGIAWHVDLVIDPFGNRMTYTYYTRTLTETVDYFVHTTSSWHSYTLTTYVNRIENINFNYPGQTTSLPPNPDTPYPTGSPGSRIAFRARWENQSWHATDPITNIFVYHGDLNSPIKEYRLQATGWQVQSPTCENEDPVPEIPRVTTTRVMTEIRLYTGTNNDPDDNDPGYALPPVTFDYDYKPHFLEQGQYCFNFYYLTEVENGYGGSVTFAYTSDNRQFGEYTTPSDSCNTNNPWPWTYPEDCYLPYGVYEWPELGYNYFVTTMTQSDGINPDTTVTYSYATPCYQQASGTAVGTLPGAHRCSMPSGEWNFLPEAGNLMGFEETTVTYKGFTGENLTRRITTFSQDYHHMGWAEESKGYMWNTTLSQFQLAQKTVNALVYQGLGGSLYFSYISDSESYQYDPNNMNHFLATRQVNEYNTAYQGGQQWGQLTQQTLYTWAKNQWAFQQRQANRYRTRTTNDYWRILPYSQGIYDNAGTARQLSLFYYDDATNNPDTQTISQGRLTLSRAVLVNTPIPGYSTRWYTSDTRLNYDSYGNVTTTKTNPAKGEVGLNGSAWSHSVLPGSATDQTTTIAYESTYNLYPISVSNALSQVTTFQIYGFNGVGLDGFQKQRGLLRAVINPNGTETRYEYDAFGRLFSLFDSSDFTGFGDATPFNGDPVIRYRYWDTTWNHSTTWLNPGGNEPFAISEHTRPDTFDGQSGQYMFKSFTYFDGLGRPIQNQNRGVTIDGVGLRDTVTVTRYNALGLTACASVPFDKNHVPNSYDPGFSTTACTSVDRTTTVYDNLGRPTSMTPPSGNATTYDYEITNFVTVDGHTNLSLTRTYDPKGYRTGQFTNSLGQLLLVRDYTGTDPQLDPYVSYSDTRYTYDILGSLTTVRTSSSNNSQPGSFLRTVSMGYDAFGRKISMNDPDMGDWSYEYDALGSLTRQTDEMGQVLCFYYDNLNRLTRKVQDSSSSTPCPTYASSPANGIYHLASYTYDIANTPDPYGIGQVAFIKWGADPDNNKDTFSYEPLGRLKTQTRTIDSRAYTMTTLTWDVLNRPLTVRTPHWMGSAYEIITLSYDHEGENTLVAGSNTLVADVKYNVRGQMTFLDRGETNFPGFDTQYSYWDNPLSGNPGTGNNDGRLKEIRHGALYDSLPNFNYTYDKAGNVLSQITQLTLGTSDTQNFGYDHLHRLTSASGSGNISGVSGYSHSYQYAGDNGKLGNMTSYAGTSYTYSGWPTGCNPFYPAPSQGLPHAVKQVGSDYHCYDKNGNMTIRTVGTTIYTQLYDVENRLTQITQNNSPTITRFSYDAAGQRTKTEIEVPGSLKTIVYYPFPGYEEEVRQSWQPCGNDCEDRGMWVTTATVKRSTYYLVGQPIATRTTDDPITGYNGLFYFLTDHLGSSNMLVQTDGVVKNYTTAYYLPFGSYRSTPPPSISPQGFTGHKHQDHVGLIYMNARFYVQGLAQFLTADTLVPNPTDPQSYNRYSYARNNPINLTDPSGHCFEDLEGNQICEDLQPLSATVLEIVPSFIPDIPPFDIFPVSLESIAGFNNVQGFGPTQIAFNHRQGTTFEWYRQSGNIHSGIDIELTEGTNLMALDNDGEVKCAGLDCGLSDNADGADGYGVAIYYPSCDCVVYYLHLESLAEGIAKDATVTKGQVVGKSGKSASGNAHLHFEIRPYYGAATWYNPLYFFTPEVLATANLSFTSYQNDRYSEWSFYGFTSKNDAGVFGFWWNGSLPSFQIK